MRTSRSRSFISVVQGLGLAWVGFAGLSVGCGGDEASGGEASGGASGGGGPLVVDEVPPPVADEPEEARPSWTEDTYELTAVATGPYAVGAPGTFEVRLTPRGEYHVNRNYPWSVTVTPPAAVLVPTATFDAATAAEMTDTIARFVVPFTPTAAGSHAVTAAVDFGICREEACIFQMHNVLVSIVAADGVAADGVPPAVLAIPPTSLPPGVEVAPPTGPAAPPPSGPPPGLEGVGATSAVPSDVVRPVPELPGGRS